MAFRGYNFRATSTYVTDAAGYVFIDVPIFPTTDGHGLESGWVTTAAEDRDRDDTLDPRLAGICQAPTNESRTFRITLPAAGAYYIRLAIGDIFAHGDQPVHVFDDATEFITITGSNGANEWIDATNTLRTSAADWIANNTAVIRNFTSTTLNVQVGSSGTSAVTIAHLSIEEVRRFLLVR